MRRFHFVPIGGTAMVPLAAMLREEGHRVTGSDRTLYPPMSTTLERLGISVADGFAPEHIPADCDAVVVGNAALRDNVEAAEAARRGLAVLSLPQAVRQFLLPGKTSVVVTGTHGKTTTSALTAWLLLDSGRDPGFLVGGEMKNLGRGYRIGRGPDFVLEGDEYNAAFFDRGPKFLHYEPRHLFIGNIEYDHADLYPDLASVVEAFRKVAALVPDDGVVVVNADDPLVVDAARATRASLARVSLADPGADFSARDILYGPDGTQFTLLEAGLPTARFSSPLSGVHNVRNALGAIALARGLGPVLRRDRPRAFALHRGPAPPGGPGRSQRDSRRRRLRASPDRRTRHAPGRPGEVPGPPSLGGLRAALEHRRPQDVRGRVCRGLRRRGRDRSGAGLPRRPPRSGSTASTAPLWSSDGSARASPRSPPRRSPRSPQFFGAKREAATCSS